MARSAALSCTVSTAAAATKNTAPRKKPSSARSRALLHAIATRKPAAASASAIQQRERKRERLAASRCFFCCSPFGVDCAPCSSPVAARSPRSSSSQVTPNTSAMTGISARSGAPSSRSQRETDLSDTFSRSASSFCVMPFARRRAARKLPIVFFSIKATSFWSLDGSILPPRQRECHPTERDCLSPCENFTPPRPISAAPSRRAAVRAPR